MAKPAKEPVVEFDENVSEELRQRAMALREKINVKFGSIRAFAYSIEIAHETVLTALYRKPTDDRLTLMHNFYKTRNLKQRINHYISEPLKLEIMRRILTHPTAISKSGRGTISAFSNANPKWSNVYLSEVLHKRKRLTVKIRLLCDFLEIDYVDINTKFYNEHEAPTQ
jgi:hypothetical protein